MNDQILKIGMPAGSLADPNRGGNLIKLLENAGFKTSGYDAGGPTKFSTVNYLFGWDGRPQEFSSQLAVNELDIAIGGDDWIKERLLELEHEYNTKVELEKVLSLNRGGVKIVGILNSDETAETTEDFLTSFFREKDLLIVVSEMPYLALDWIRQKMKVLNLLDKFPAYSVQKYKTPSKIQKGVLIFETWGKTESKVKNKGADIGMEITQTGSAIKSYGLKIIDTIMNSQTGIFINPSIKADKQKSELLQMFLLNLYGCINAENKVMLVFNVPNSSAKEVEDYMAQNNLFADEPTMTIGKNYTVYNIQVDLSDSKLPIAMVRYELAKRKARNIDTMPIQSSIRGLDSVVF